MAAHETEPVLRIVQRPTALNIGVVPIQHEYAGVKARPALRVLSDSQKETFPYEEAVAGLELQILPGVYSPRYFPESSWFAEILPFAFGEEVLNMGSGSGVVAIAAALRGARVTAIDCYRAAARNTRLNAKRHRVEHKVKVFEGDLFSPVRGRRFDVIFWNHPHVYVKSSKRTNLERTLVDPTYHTLDRFLRPARRHLKPGGRLYLGTSSTLGKPELVRDRAWDRNWAIDVLATMRTLEATPVQYELVQLHHLSSVRDLSALNSGAFSR